MRRLLFALLVFAIPAMATDEASAGCRRHARVYSCGCGAPACGAYAGEGYGYGATYGAPAPIYGYYAAPPIVIATPVPANFGYYPDPRYYRPYVYGVRPDAYGYGYGYGYGYESRDRYYGAGW